MTGIILYGTALRKLIVIVIVNKEYYGYVQCVKVAVCESCGVWELQCVGFAVCGRCGVWTLWCVSVDVYRCCNVCRSSNEWKLLCVMCSLEFHNASTTLEIKDAPSLDNRDSVIFSLI